MDDPTSAELAAVTRQRDTLICHLYALGWTVVGIAQVAGMSPSAVGRVVADAHPGGMVAVRL